jgi:hypothetical protein
MNWENIKVPFDDPDRKSFAPVDKLLRWVGIYEFPSLDYSRFC